MSDESDFEVPEFLKETYRQQERERIIDLLKPQVQAYYDKGLGFTASFIERTIQQIKGEQK